MEIKKDPFEVLMETVGYNGRFQKIYIWVLVMGITFCWAMIYMNIILALNVPDHWCYVPGIEKTNLTIEEWKNLTLPVKTDNRGAEKFSSCEMYNINITADTLLNNNFELNDPRESVACLHGFEYDKQWYEATIPMKENWVCEKDLYATNIYVFSRASEVFGTIIFGQLGDICGRRLIFIISLIVTTLGRAISILVTSSYTWFIVATIICSLTMTSFYQSPIVVAMEISKDDHRATLAFVQNVGFSMGATIMPLLFWWVKHYIPYMCLTTVAPLFIILILNYVIESPRWLISKKRFGDAKKQLQRIAKINGTTFKISEEEMAKMFADVKKEHVYGVASLFSAWRLARNTIIMCLVSCIEAVAYFTLVLSISQMAGNPFLNYFLQNVMEIPSNFLAKYLTDAIGRRTTTSLCFTISGLLCIPAIFLATDLKYGIYLVVLSSIIKFVNVITYFSATLQTMEFYPTCLRQTGQSLGTTVANAVGILSPFFAYLGLKYDIRYPFYILVVLYLFGGTIAACFPETLHQKLPDTLEDAKLFGRNQAFWSLPKRRKSSINKSETVKLNLKEYAP